MATWVEQHLQAWKVGCRLGFQPNQAPEYKYWMCNWGVGSEDRTYVLKARKTATADQPGQSFEDIAFRGFLRNLVNEQVPLGEAFVCHGARAGPQPLRVLWRSLGNRLGLRPVMDGLEQVRKKFHSFHFHFLWQETHWHEDIKGWLANEVVKSSIVNFRLVLQVQRNISGKSLWTLHVSEYGYSSPRKHSSN